MKNNALSSNDRVARWVLVAATLASSMAFIDGTALSVALPALQTDLGASGADLLWVTNGFSLPLAALLLFGGALGDHFGRKRVFTVGILVFIGASMACGLSPSVSALIAARVGQGVGAALMIPGSLAMISSHFAPEGRGRAIGAWSAFSVLATTLGPILGGILAGAGFWRAIFFINVPLAAMVLFLLARKVPPDAGIVASTRLDTKGAVSVSVGLAGLNYGLIRLSDAAFGDPWVIGPLVVGLIGLAVFAHAQLTVTQPLLPFGIFRNRVLAGASAVSFLYYIAFHGALFFLPLNLIQVQGYQPAQAGLSQVPIMVLLVALSSFAGRWVDRAGPRWPLALGSLVTGVGFFWLGLVGVTAGPAMFWTSFFPPLCVVGVGLGLTAAPVSATLMSSVDAAQLGLASGINSTLTRLAGVLAVSVLGAFMLVLFRQALLSRMGLVDLPTDALAQLASDARKLGGTPVPQGLAGTVVMQVRDGIRLAFVDGFRWMMVVAAGLCWTAALIAAISLRAPRRT